MRKNTTVLDPRKTLLAARADLLHRKDHREDLVVERFADPIDEALQLAQRESAAGVVSADTRMLHDIDGALERIDAGTYGVCDGCGDPIPKARLAALPWALLCIGCQEEIERSAG